jgi:hypothetical protein
MDGVPSKKPSVGLKIVNSWVTYLVIFLLIAEMADVMSAEALATR